MIEEDTSARELSELNLSYLLLAQRMLRTDRTSAMLRLGMNDEVADTLVALTVTQAVKLARSQFSLCAFKLSDLPVTKVLADPHGLGLEQAHMSIVFASRRTEERMAA